jgi:hypothetical protein
MNQTTIFPIDNHKQRIGHDSLLPAPEEIDILELHLGLFEVHLLVALRGFGDLGFEHVVAIETRTLGSAFQLAVVTFAVLFTALRLLAGTALMRRVAQG